jgi:hypothetical protein
MSLKNPVTRLGIDPGAVRIVAQRLNHYATTGPFVQIYQVILERKNQGNLDGRDHNTSWEDEKLIQDSFANYEWEKDFGSGEEE